VTTWHSIAADPLDWLVSELSRVEGGIPRRAVVLLPSPPHAHELRRRVCVELQRPALLAGVWLTDPLRLAREALALAAVQPLLPRADVDDAGAAVLLCAAAEFRRAPPWRAGFGAVTALLTAPAPAALQTFLDSLGDCRVGTLTASRPQLGAVLVSNLADVGDALETSPLTPLRRGEGNRTSEAGLPPSLAGKGARGLGSGVAAANLGQPAPLALPAVSPSREQQVEAAIVWLTEQISAGVPLERIALLVDDVDAYAPMLIDRMQRLPAGDLLRAYVAGGLPLATTSAGERLHSLLAALASGLSAVATIRVLPALKRGPGDDPSGPLRLSPSRAAAVVYGAGIAGGTPSSIDGLRDWVPRLRRRRAALLAVVEAADKADAARQTIISRQQAERWLRDVEPILPAVTALQALGELVATAASAAEIWQGILDFCKRWLRLPANPPDLLERLDRPLRPEINDPATARGFGAVQVVSDALRDARHTTIAYGTPAVFLGTPEQAAGLPFRVVRDVAAAAPLDRAQRQAYAREHPLTPQSILAYAPRFAESGLGVPTEWLASVDTAVDRIHEADAARRRPLWSTMDGDVAEAWPLLQPPGLSPRRPISASALALLLTCPHRFLLERVLHLSAPAPPPATDAIDPIVYGALFHSAADRFLRESGAAICRQEGDLGELVQRAGVIAAAQLDGLRDVYPLRDSSAAQREQQRLLVQIEALVRDEWARPRRQFVASEMRFGEPQPVRLSVDGGELYARGSIDRVDRFADGTLSVRDLKTGRLVDVPEQPLNAARDLQIGVYAMVLQESARVSEAAYVSPGPSTTLKRVFAGPAVERLQQSTRQWLSLAHTLLHKGMFPRTPVAADCRYCPFLSACGSGAQQRSAAKLAALPTSHPLHDFLQFKLQGEALAVNNQVEVE
jgi:RecB family exonuclease